MFFIFFNTVFISFIYFFRIIEKNGRLRLIFQRQELYVLKTLKKEAHQCL